MQNNLRGLRMARGLTQAELAKAIGASQQQIGRLEAGTRQITQRWLEKLCGVLGVTADAVLGLEVDTPARRRPVAETPQERLHQDVRDLLAAVDGLRTELREALATFRADHAPAPGVRASLLRRIGGRR